MNAAEAQAPSSAPESAHETRRDHSVSPMAPSGDDDTALDHALADALLAQLSAPTAGTPVTAPLGDDRQILRETFVALSRAQREGHVALHLPRWLERHVQADGSRLDADARRRWRETLTAVLAPHPAAERNDDETPANPLAGFVRLDGPRQEWLYLERLYRREAGLADALLARAQQRIDWPPGSQRDAHIETLKGAIDRLLPLEYDRDGALATRSLDQRRALAIAWRHPLAILVGGPGTGKTFTLVRLLALLVETRPLWHEPAHLSGIEGTPRPADALRIHLAAPTGKAAQRMTEAVREARDALSGRVDAAVLDTIPNTATTLHRLLLTARRRAADWSSARGRPTLDADIVVVDEASMVDLELMARLFEALPPQARVVLIGDPDQLPSVGAGSVLAALASAAPKTPSADVRRWLADLDLEDTAGGRAAPQHVGRPIRPKRGRPVARHDDRQLPLPLEPAHPETTRAAERQAASAADDQPRACQTIVLPFGDGVARLSQPRRFQADSGIAAFARAILAGDAEAALAALAGHDDLVWHRPSDTPLAAWLDPLAQKYHEEIDGADDEGAALSALGRRRVLCAFRVGPFGANVLDARLAAQVQALAGNVGAPTRVGRRPILIRKNDPVTGLFNGDVGLLWPTSNGRLEAVFDDPARGRRRIPAVRLPPWESVYAMTIHKTQGSEFEHVAIVLPEHDHELLSRELLYTAVTRAKKRLTLWASEAILRAAIARPVLRDSALTERLTAPRTSL